MSESLKRVFGIDLGTTYSAIAYVDEHGKPVVVANQESERITPSVVLFDGEAIIVGNTAKETAKVEPDRVVTRVKQHMGDPNFVFAVDGQRYNAEEISSFILRKVVGDAELALDAGPITDVVITCPAYFGTAEREATANAGRLAGLNVRAVLNEPTAAAIAYGLEGGDDQVVLVYDLGGGTFDVTMIEIKQKLIQVICTGGDHRLGGALWDEAIVMYLAEQFHQITGEESDPLDDPEVLNDLFLQAERGKKTLTHREKAPFRVTHAGQQARVEIDRDQFNTMTQHLLDRTIELTREMLAEAEKKGYTQFDAIILVGGATRMPQVATALVEAFGKPPEAYDPDESVAKGAALFGLKESLSDEVKQIMTEQVASLTGPHNGHQAGALGQGDVPAIIDVEVDQVEPQRVEQVLDQIEQKYDFTLTGPVRDLVGTRIVNVLSKSLGIVAKDASGREQVVFLLQRNGSVPMEHRQDFGTDSANQEAVDLRVRAGEGESTSIADTTEVGIATLNLPPGLPERSPIRVTFAISGDGRLTVTGQDLTSGGEIQVDFETEAVLDEAELTERTTALQILNVS